MSLTVERNDHGIIYESGFSPVPGGWAGVIYWRVHRGRKRNLIYHCSHEHDSTAQAWQCARDYMPNIPRQAAS